MSINRKDQAREAKAHRLYKATKPTNLVAPITYGNANTSGFYTGNLMGSPRPEANNQINSLPMGAQILRCV